TRIDRPGDLSHWLKNTRLQGEQLLEFERLAPPGKGRVVGQLLAVLVALFESLSQVLEGEFVAPVLSVNGSHHVVEFGAILHAALLQQRTVAGVVLEDLGIELERDAVFLVGERQQVARVVGGSEVAVDGCRIGRELDGLLILRDGPAVAFGSVVHRTQIVDRFGVGWLQLDGLLVVFPGYIELHELMVRDADFIAQHGIFRRTLAEGFDGLTIHLASHENIAAALGGENRFGRFHLGGAGAVDHGVGSNCARLCEPESGADARRQRHGPRSVNHMAPCCYLNTRHMRWRTPLFSAGFLVSSFGDAGGGTAAAAAWPEDWRAARRAAESGGAIPSPREPVTVGAECVRGCWAGGGLVSHPATLVIPLRPPCSGQTPTGSVPAM